MQITETLINAYAELTDDFNPIHVDPAFAATTPMGGVIAHGTLSLGLIWQAIHRRFGPAAIGQVALDVRFVRPVRLGERVEACLIDRDGEPGVHDVRVTADDGTDRIVGSLRIAGPTVGGPATATARESTGGGR